MTPFFSRFIFRPVQSLVFPLLLTLGLVAGTPLWAANPGSETWYRVEIADRPAGSIHIQQLHQNGEIETRIDQVMTFRRGQAEQRIELSSGFTESQDGKPIRAFTRQLLGGQERKSFYDFSGDEILVRSAPPPSGAIESRIPKSSEPWLTPVKTQQRLIEALAAGKETLSVRTVDPALSLEPIRIDWKRIHERVELRDGERVWQVSEWEQRQSWAPQIVTRVYLDADGQTIRSETELFGMKVVQWLAEGEVVAETSPESPELLLQTFVKPEPSMERPRMARRAVYELSSSRDLPPLPKTSVQSVVQGDEITRVVVDLRASRAGNPTDLDGGGGIDPDGAGPDDGIDPDDAVDRKKYVEATRYYDYQHPSIQRILAGQTLPSEPRKRAAALRTWVHHHVVDKNLDSIFDTASEVAASLAGDCTEHSVLLTALLRAAGIPARSVAGLIYAEEFVGQRDIFAYHMWSQAWIDGHWTDLDATLGPLPFDAAHIALQILTLADEPTTLRELASIIPIMGDLHIRIREVAYD